jgi:cytochrome c oxidase subunit 2
MPPESGSILDPQSGYAKAISDTFITTMIIGLGVFLLVTVLVLIAVTRYRHRAGDDTEPEQTAGNTRLELAWTVGPIILAASLMVLTFVTMGNSDPAKPTNAASVQPDIEIIGHQWWWEYRYPKDGVVTANELHLPLGRQMYTKLYSADVLHQWWVPNLSRMINTNSGPQVNYLYLKPDKPGQYVGACAQYCGGPHAWMLIKVFVQPEDQFNAWLQSQKQAASGAAATPAPNAAVGNPSAPTTPINPFKPGESSVQGGDPAKGAQVFLKNTCVNCHAIQGTTANAMVGPSLSHIGGRSIIGAGVMNNTPENLAKWIFNPQIVKPGVLMPGYQLNEDDMRNLVAYLEGLK